MKFNKDNLEKARFLNFVTFQLQALENKRNFMILINGKLKYQDQNIKFFLNLEETENDSFDYFIKTKTSF